MLGLQLYLQLLSVGHERIWRHSELTFFISSNLDLPKQVRPRTAGPILGGQGTYMKCLVRVETVVGTFVVMRVQIGVAKLVNNLVCEFLWWCSVWGHGGRCDGRLG